MNKLKIWKEDSSWEESNKAWDERSIEASHSHPLKIPKSLPSMIGITEDTAKNLKWKSIKWMVQEDKSGKITKNILSKPIKYGLSFIKSALKKESFLRDDDFFYYGIKNIDEFKELLKRPDTLFVIGFSYCHKPHECPSGRFTTDCIHDESNPVCQQCFIGKCTNALPKHQTKPLFITTIHYIGEQIFEIVNANPDKKVIFLITACEMTRTMFGDFGNMVGIQGVGVRLDGRICNTMKAFELSEKGIKPGLTVVLDHTQRRMFDLIRTRREHLPD